MSVEKGKEISRSKIKWICKYEGCSHSIEYSNTFEIFVAHLLTHGVKITQPIRPLL